MLVPLYTFYVLGVHPLFGLVLLIYSYLCNKKNDFAILLFQVFKLGIGADLPYRMAVHPGGEGLICSLPKSCKYIFSLFFSLTSNHRVV